MIWNSRSFRFDRLSDPTKLCETKKITRFLNSDNLDVEFHIKRKTCGKKFKRNAQLTPIIWIYQYCGLATQADQAKFKKHYKADLMYVETILKERSVEAPPID